MGSALADYPEEGPVFSASVDGFWIDESPVTVAQFRRFVKATGYRTTAERPWEPAQYGELPGEPPPPGSLVFFPTRGPVDLGDVANWWHYVPGADWAHPEGPESNVVGREYHPVVHVAWEDVTAYAQWAGKEIATEAEWERAARGGLDGARYSWGDEFSPRGKLMANVWLGAFPWENLKPVARRRTTPIRSYPPNGYGLYDVTGNVWEWTSDLFQGSRAEASGSACCAVDTTRREHASTVGGGEPQIPRRVLKGGSHLCSENYCLRYRPAARQAQMVDSAMSHIGFRCVVRV